MSKYLRHCKPIFTGKHRRQINKKVYFKSLFNLVAKQRLSDMTLENWLRGGRSSDTVLETSIFLYLAECVAHSVSGGWSESARPSLLALLALPWCHIEGIMRCFNLGWTTYDGHWWPRHEVPEDNWRLNIQYTEIFWSFTLFRCAVCGAIEQRFLSGSLGWSWCT